ncbi:MAG: hypothetical protein OQJ97_02810 [Rhodospirillales bacterium]|nr:hypothetical protein [Rhodospirillales bacterium]
MAFLPSSPSQAIELGLTPSDVYGLWTNVNSALISFSKQQNIDKQQRITALPLKTFNNKKPKDVLARVAKFRTKLIELPFSTKGRTEGLLTKELSFLLRDSQALVTPSLVFLHSGQVLVETVTVLSHNSHGKSPIGSFFIFEKFREKTPSNVYGQVDLAHRRLELILESIKAQKLEITRLQE